MTPSALPIELVIFDCDGVLVDSEPIGVRYDMLMLERVGLVMTEAEVIDRFVGRSGSVLREYIEDELGHPLDRALEDEMRQFYLDALAADLHAVDGVSDALARIDVPMCVASSSEPDSLRWKLRHVGLLDHFGGIFSAAEVEHGKPAPDLFLYAARRMGVAPDRCAVVEDSQYGVQAARAAGMAVFAYASGFTDSTRLTGDHTTIFTDMRDLPELLARSVM